MNRNTNMKFASNPTSLDIPRSKFKIPFDHKTTLNTGDLVPIGIWETLPGDTVKIDLASLVRMTTPIFPVADNCYMDIYFFSCANRLVWSHWKEFMGENTTSYWTQEIEYTIPQVTAPAGGWQKGTIADYLGIPIGVENISVDALPFRKVALIYNEWFRDENLVEPLDINMGDATTAGSNGDDATNDVQCGGMPPKVAKYADYFTTALPSPQKGPDVYIPLGATAPIIGTADVSEQYTDSLDENLVDKRLYLGGSGIAPVWTTDNPSTSIGAGKNIGIVADLASATGATINQLRQSFAIQRMYEKDARGGWANA